MHPRLTELLEYTEAQREVLLAAVARVPEALRQLRPAPDAWSVAEVLEHLHRAERGIAKLIGQTLEQGKAKGLEPEREIGSMLGSLDRYGLARRDTRVRSPEFVLPRGELTAAQALAALAESRNRLRAAVRACDGCAIGRLTFPHAILGPLTLYQWILFVGEHEARHALQIREIGEQLTPAPQSPA
jgi:DinB superfamily